jgi:hypothetical protein
MKTQAKTDAQEARAELLKILRPGDTVYTILRHISKSGMTRHIDVYTIQGNKPLYLTAYVSKACGIRRLGPGAPMWSLVVGGCGMDMGFHVVYCLGAALWPNGAASAIHRADKSYTRNRNGNTGPETDGGYMLRQEWV